MHIRFEMKQPLIGSDSKSYLHGRVPKSLLPSGWSPVLLRLLPSLVSASPSVLAATAAAFGASPESGLMPTKNDADDMRVKLRAIFDKFDTNHSDTISATELKQVIAATKIKVPPAEIRRMIGEADSDGSGEIEFEEFFATMMKQLRAGKGAEGGGLLSVVAQSSSTFGWLNPLSWFSGQDPSRAKTIAVQTSSKELNMAAAKAAMIESETVAQATSNSPSPSRRRRHHSPSTMSTNAHAEGSTSNRTGRSSGDYTGSVRSKMSVMSQWKVMQQNMQSAEEQRQAERELRERRAKSQQHFVEQQRRRIQRFQDEEVAGRISLEAFKATKREVGVEMRQELAAAYMKNQAKLQDHVDAMSRVTRDARRAKQIKVAARREEQVRTAEEVGIQAQIERRRRREESLATVRQQTKAAQDFAAQVRFETRPEVRKETRDYFQAKRNKVYATVKLQREDNRKKVSGEREHFLGVAAQKVVDAKNTRENAHDRQALIVKRHQAKAEETKRQLEADLERRRRQDHEYSRVIKERHDEVIRERFNPTNEELDGPRVNAWMSQASPSLIRAGLKAKSRRWETQQAGTPEQPPDAAKL